MNQSSYTQKLEKEFHEIFSLRPNDLGNRNLTMMYKLLTRPLKSMPFVFIIPISFVAAIMLYVLFGHLVVNLVSLLQYGF